MRRIAHGRRSNGSAPDAQPSSDAATELRAAPAPGLEAAIGGLELNSISEPTSDAETEAELVRRIDDN